MANLVRINILQEISMYTVYTFDCILDIDECQGDHGCDQECINDVGGFHCECGTGYQLVDMFTCAGQLVACTIFYNLPHSISNQLFLFSIVDVVMYY